MERPRRSGGSRGGAADQESHRRHPGSVGAARRRAHPRAGCGHGALAKALALAGAKVVGVDPEPAALIAARRAVPAALFVQAGAEALPVRDAAFEGAVFQNALHHIPVPLMPAALRAAVRAVCPGRPVVVVEPLAAGAFFEVLRPIEDETALRAAAQDALAAATAAGSDIALVDEQSFLRVSVFESFEAAIAMMLAADPARAAAAAAKDAELRARFVEFAAPVPGGFRLEQPMRASILQGRP
ncbi:MAG TPA: methyltransferase domain-containing protein [Microvirga sp.]|nr:methyltransferase domain-containing protein [Microvirga sp.]